MLHRWIAARGSARAQSAIVAPAEFRLERAAATALGRAAERQAQLPVFVEKVELARMTLSELPEILPERALLAVIEGRRDAIGVAAICPDLLASLIEMQAIGRVTARPAPARKPTRTDASISADFVNALLGELGRECQGQDAPNFAAFRYATYMDDPRPLSLMLEDGDMVRLTLRFRIGPGGQRDGTLVIALPLERDMRIPPPEAARLAAILPGTPVAPIQAPGAALAEVVQQAPVALVGILCRRKVSLQLLRNLTPGALIPLPSNVLDDARIETTRGQLLARGRLGEAEGFHAIRLRDLSQETASRTAPPAWPAGSLATGSASTTPLPPDPQEPPLQDYHEADPFRGADPDPDATPVRFAG
ncbi:FliM/FliN family flagellar motor C-terminal domain-containing protein [Paracoccus sp. N5]|uniref:FliM/FliN family flagellar motor switch protein n=1 Tax=Paracoccus sp. N5 TaxID=1101189 RepID=UPI00035D3CA5|nr:FliM/FliN family flagellar motor C-terminal domain-containing protein [Paracoccus sp. N5]